MRFDTFTPSDRLKPYVKYFVLSENEFESEYKVFPSAGIVIGFQYKGKLSAIQDLGETALSSAGITGITDSYKIFRNSRDTGTVLVYFTELGFSQFAANPANELFNQSISLENIFDKSKVSETEEKLFFAKTDRQRISIVEYFLLSQLKNIQTDKLIMEALTMIYHAKGNIRIRELSEKLFISQSPLEKRFRKYVGTSPKKFASIIRFNSVIDDLNDRKSLAEICFDNNFFDQAHFIKDFKQYTGDTPENFKRFL
ncbi:helix-turn-helix domain-containing protein [Chryseobacterium shigense]|uniref:AraC-like DNA-binding protein n=1 Tax=Chryseobacterium shigense TaxID=297244 RepID=A0A841N8E1_9FLAO|nr:helix-turn-helix domain-containing protein [Chryseobacterium shigense]MBB6371343.1 AraC-like DNA-binding protein [Chryseobacterium shigense]